MDCKKVEDLISLYIEDELPAELHKEIALHIEQCDECRKLKEKVEELIYVFPDLEEEVPFYLKNRLYYIPESQDPEEIIQESRFYFMKWVAAMIGTFVLFLNLFYFTNFFPPANRFLHSAVSEIKVFTVETGAFIDKVTESRGTILFSIFKKDKEKVVKKDVNKVNKSKISDRDPGFDRNKPTDSGTQNNKGGKNDGK